MRAFIEGKWIDFSKYEYFGGMTDGAAYEDLYRTPYGSWSLYTRHIAALKEATLHMIPEEEAIGWVIRLRHNQEEEVIQGPMRRARSSVPEWVVPREEYHRCGKECRTGPPPMGQQVDLLLSNGSPTAEQIEARQLRLLELARVLEYLMWPSPVDGAMTADFREEGHDPLVEQLQEELESKLFENPRLFLPNRSRIGTATS